MAIIASPALSLLSLRLAQIVGEVCRAVAWRGGRDHALIPLVNMAWNRINRTAQMFDRLLARIASGRKAPLRKTGGTRVCKQRDPAAFRLPRNFCWLVVRMPETASYGSQLRHWLDDPQMAALLAAEPRAARILRPLCRMLGVAHPSVGVREPASAGAPKRPAKPPTGISRPRQIPAPEPVPHTRPARWVVWRRDD